MANLGETLSRERFANTNRSHYDATIMLRNTFKAHGEQMTDVPRRWSLRIEAAAAA
jgi:hypothetical protein